MADLEENARRKAAGKKDISLSPIAIEIVRRIDALFAIERTINGQSADYRSRIDARIVIAPGQRQDAKAGAKALLGMRPGLDDDLEERRGRWTDLLAGGDQASRCPLAVATMGARHVIGDGGMAAPVGRTGVTGDPLSLVEDLDGLVGDTDIDQLKDQAVRGGIPVAVDLDVVVGGDAATLPARKDVTLVRQFSQLGTIDLGEQFGPARTEYSKACVARYTRRVYQEFRF